MKTPLGLAVLVAGLAGCGTPEPPPVWHSLVPAAVAVASAPSPAANALSIAVGRIAVPEEVDRPELVLRSPAGIRLLADQRWSEPLKAQLPRALALALSQRLPGALTSAYPASPPAPAAGRLSLEVQRFELHEGPAARASLRVLWTWRPPSGAGSSRVAEVTVGAAGGSGAQALVDAMGLALGRVGDEIAAAIR